MPKDIKIDFMDKRSVKKAKKEISDLMNKSRSPSTKFLKNLVKEINDKFMTPLLDDLRKYPPERNRNRPLKWTSQKQHRYIMYMWRKRKINLPTSRTSNLADSWYAKATLVNNYIQITVSSDDPAYQFVVGRIGFNSKRKDIKEYEKYQQRYHKETGWRPAHTVIRPYMNQIRNYINEQLGNI